MKKFLVAFDSLRFSENAMSYAIFLAKHANAHLVGIFLEDRLLHSYSPSELTFYIGGTYDQQLRQLNKRDDDARQACIGVYRHACETAGIPCSVHRDRNTPIRELLHESVYADFMIIDAHETLNIKEGAPPTHFICELLQEVQCPVLLVPRHYQRIDQVKLLYDGSPSSVLALRAFSYLFEDLKHLETEVITASVDVKGLHIPDNRLIKEFSKRHFPEARYTMLKGHPDEAVVEHLRPMKGGAMVVLGAYRRSSLSRLLKPSMTDYLLRHLNQPLFVAHHCS